MKAVIALVIVAAVIAFALKVGGQVTARVATVERTLQGDLR